MNFRVLGGVDVVSGSIGAARLYIRAEVIFNDANHSPGTDTATEPWDIISSNPYPMVAIFSLNQPTGMCLDNAETVQTPNSSRLWRCRVELTLMSIRGEEYSR